MNGTTLKQLGWNVDKERTDPPTRKTDIEVWINRGSNVFKLKNPDNPDETIQMEDAVQVEP